MQPPAHEQSAAEAIEYFFDPAGKLAFALAVIIRISGIAVSEAHAILEGFLSHNL